MRCRIASPVYASLPLFLSAFGGPGIGIGQLHGKGHRVQAVAGLGLAAFAMWSQKRSRWALRICAAFLLLRASAATGFQSQGRSAANMAKLAVLNWPSTSMKRAMPGISKFNSSEITLVAPKVMP